MIPTIVRDRQLRCAKPGKAAAALLLWVWFAGTGLSLAEPPGARSTESISDHSPLAWFQKYVSRADGNRCPMYPSCSHYAAEAFKKHGAVLGWVLTCDRLMRCGHDEVRRAPAIIRNGVTYSYDPLDDNTSWWKKK